MSTMVIVASREEVEVNSSNSSAVAQVTEIGTTIGRANSQIGSRIEGIVRKKLESEIRESQSSRASLEEKENTTKNPNLTLKLSHHVCRDEENSMVAANSKIKAGSPMMRSSIQGATIVDTVTEDEIHFLKRMILFEKRL